MKRTQPASHYVSDALKVQIDCFKVIFGDEWATLERAEGFCDEASREFRSHLRELRYAGLHRIVEFWTNPDFGVEPENHYANVILDQDTELVVDWTARQFGTDAMGAPPYPYVAPIAVYVSELGWDGYSDARF